MAPSARRDDSPESKIPLLPQAVALVNLCTADGGAEAVGEHLLSDFRDALLAYERMSEIALGSPGASCAPAFINPDGCSTGSARADTAVLAAHAADCAELELDSMAGESGMLLSGARAYAIVLTEHVDPLAAEHAAQALEHWALEHGYSWCGALLVAGLAEAQRSCTSPRMGWLRRHRSEGIDALVGAVRAGSTIAAAFEGYGAPTELTRRNILCARCAMPAPIYRLLFANAG